MGTPEDDQIQGLGRVCVCVSGGGGWHQRLFQGRKEEAKAIDWEQGESRKRRIAIFEGPREEIIFLALSEGTEFFY